MDKIVNPTSRDIADIAGVSQATVSRALRGSPLVRKETRDKIQQIAHELNYFVNRNAAGLRTQQSSTIALLMFDESDKSEPEINPFFLSMLGNITRSAASYGYDLLVSVQQQTNDWHIEYQASHRADGLILLGYGDYRDYAHQLSALADAHTRFIIWGPIVEGQLGYSFGCDNQDGGFQATEHLLTHGRRHIAFLGKKSTGSPELAARHAGYLAAHEKFAVPINAELFVRADNSEDSGYVEVQRLIASGKKFDSIFASTDTLAIGAMRAIQDSGLNVPRDISIVGFDDVALASHVAPPLTTVQQNTHLAAEGLVGSIVSLIRGEPIESHMMAPVLIVRESSIPD